MLKFARTIAVLTLCAALWAGGAERAAGAAPETYIVQAGDTLYAIATRYRTTVNVLKQLNALASDTIVVGQKLAVPASDALMLTVPVIVAPALDGVDGELLLQPTATARTSTQQIALRIRVIASDDRTSASRGLHKFRRNSPDSGSQF